jgi:hypothetical protein
MFVFPTFYLFLPPPLGDHVSIFRDTGAKLLLSSLCRRGGISLASLYSSSLKSYIPFPSFLPWQAHSLVIFLFSFYLSSQRLPLLHRQFSLLFTLSSFGGWYFLSTDVQAMLL